MYCHYILVVEPRPRTALMLSSAVSPVRTLEVALAAERAGVRRLWLTEDYFLKAGFSSAAAAPTS